MTEQDRPNPAEAEREIPAASPDAASSPRSQAQEAELAALEAMLPARNTSPEAGRDAEAGQAPCDPHPAQQQDGKSPSDEG